jgi:DNA-binding FadR family transcriptional regulator
MTVGSDVPTFGERLYQPRLAEMVADVLRRRILDGSLRDGDALPTEEQLLAEFGVSKPSLREGLRILETEGLVTVRRGNIGGATVHVPSSQAAARMLGMVLQSERVTLADLANALRQFEPLCAGLCAARPDRLDTVVPTLRAIHDEEVGVVDDQQATLALGRRFHETLVSECGNQTIIHVIGTLESLWSSHEQQWARRVHPDGLPDVRSRRAGHRAHGRIITLVEQGDIDAVTKIVRRHIEGAQAFALSVDGHRVVDVTPRVRP